MAARFRKPSSGKAVPVTPRQNPTGPYTPEDIVEPAEPRMAPQPKMDKLDKFSAALWNILSGLGEMGKQDIKLLKSDPVGATVRTLDELTVGQEARDRFRKGDYAGALNKSGAGSMLSLPELDRLVRGKASMADSGWLAATYLGGPLAKTAKQATSMSKKALLKTLTRLPK
jgi:hypothetical protein